MVELEGTNVALGVTGSIAAVKVVELVHELRRHGASVRGVMTAAAQDIIHPWAVEFATDQSVVTELTGAVEHVELCGEDGWADVFLIAPATANTIGKMAGAIDDTPVTTCATTAVGSGCPVVVAPAMHEPMYDHPGVLDAIDRLEDWGVEFIPPRLAEGKAKIAAEETIVLDTARATGPTPLADQQIVITGGPTAEPIDPVRVLTNHASGQTGLEIAKACYVRGASVTLIGDYNTVPYADIQAVETAEEMRTAVIDGIDTADAFIAAAAVGDFTVETRSEKLDSSTPIQLELKPGPKIVDAVRDHAPTIPIVAFKLETTDDDTELIAAARELRDRIDAAFVVANTPATMGATTTTAHLVDAETSDTFEGTKAELAAAIATRLTHEFG